MPPAPPVADDALPAAAIDPILLFAAEARDLKRLVADPQRSRPATVSEAMWSVAVTLRQSAHDTLHRNGLSFTQARILLELRRCAHFVSATALARRLGLSKPVVGEACASLYARGLISRNGELAGRGLNIALTGPGSDLAHSLAAWFGRHEANDRRPTPAAA